MSNLSLFDPSEVWMEWLRQIEFLNQVDEKYLRSLVGFGYYLGSPIEKDIWRVNRSQHAKDCDSLVSDYKRIVLDEPELLLSELDPSRGFFSLLSEINGKDCWINTDVVRMQVDLSNMSRLGLLTAANKVCEIGGGYGQLAVGLLTIRESLSYTIIDFPQILGVVERWAAYLKISSPIRYYRDLESYLKYSSSPGLHLLPNSLMEENSKLEFDLCININSFCEMTKSQIEFYMDSINFRLCYSNNRDRQINNTQLDSLSAIFTDYYDIYPNPKSYEDSYFKKAVYALGDLTLIKRIPIDAIQGIRGGEMPGLEP
mgnify:CR=1 FL=1